MLKQVLKKIVRGQEDLPPEAANEVRRDAEGLPPQAPGIEDSVREALRWIGRAQDNSISQDGGVARHYSLKKGWSASYPETTGYIIPTMLDCGRRFADPELTARGRRMVDWLVSIQFADGAFQGGTVDQTPAVPVTFNTGQILFGLAAGAKEFGDAYRQPMQRAADWLVRTQAPNGSWPNNQSPYVTPGVKTYDTHVAWSLLEADRVHPGAGYGEAGLRHIRWAMTRQQDNGWMEDCCLTDAAEPLTHTLGYALRGILEGYRYSKDEELLKSGRRLADGLAGAVREGGRLPGRLRRDWNAAADWVCLTGSVQIAYCWLMLHEYTGERRYLDTAAAVNQYVRRSVRLDGPPQTRGAVKGSFPVNGGYGTYQYLNWAAKFFIDSHLYELERRGN